MDNTINQVPKECNVRILCNPNSGNIMLQTATGNSWVTVTKENNPAIHSFLLNLKGIESPSR